MNPNVINKRYILNPTTMPVRGHKRSMLIDLSPGYVSYHLIPNALYEILSFNTSSTIAEVIQRYSAGNPSTEETILEYFQFLTDNDLIHFTEFPDHFPRMNLSWEYPAVVSNAIIDINRASKINLEDTFDQLTRLGCTDIQLRFFRKTDYESVKAILETLNRSVVKSIEMLLPIDDEFNFAQWERLTARYPRLKYLQFYGAEKSELLKECNPSGMGFIVTVKDQLEGAGLCCGVIGPHYFTVNIPAFTEAQQHNSCLNRKIAIDSQGNIKNCPSMAQSFGNISDTTLQEAVKHPDFKKYWNISKDQIQVCRDCEFRYICTDCRAFTEDPQDAYSKPLKCGYNPYTCEWSDWSNHPMKQPSIDYYGMRNVLAEFKMKPDYVPQKSTRTELVPA